MSVELVEILSTDVEGYSPLKVIIKWKNNKLPHGKELYCINLFTVYNEQNNQWEFVNFDVNGVYYLWGSIIVAIAPYQGEEDEEIHLTYALNPPKTVNCGCYIILIEPAVEVNEYKVDFGKGSRTIGLNMSDLNELVETAQVYAVKHFPNTFVLHPYTAPAEITQCYVKID